MHSTAAGEHAQPTESADGYDESFRNTLANIVKDVLGAEVSVHQPFMEVRSLLCQPSWMILCQMTGGPNSSDVDI